MSILVIAEAKYYLLMTLLMQTNWLKMWLNLLLN